MQFLSEQSFLIAADKDVINSRFFKKAKISHLIWILLGKHQIIGRFCQIFVAFLETLNFPILVLGDNKNYSTDKKSEYKFKHNFKMALAP